MSRLLFAVRRRFGLCWQRSLPWDEIIDRIDDFLIAAMVIVVFFLITNLLELRESVGREKHAAEQAQQTLLNCLNDRLILTDGQVGIRCKPIEIKL